MFRSTDNGDSWAEQNSGFTAFDANAVTFNSRGDVFAAAAGGVFRSFNNGDQYGATSASGVLPQPEMFGRWRSAAPHPEDLCILERLAAEYLAASYPLPRCEPFRGLARVSRQRRGRKRLLESPHHC
jgi:hypothetical protein